MTALLHNPADWTLIGDVDPSEWYWDGDVLYQDSVNGEYDPQEAIYTPYTGDQNRTISCMVYFDGYDPDHGNDGRVGISLLNNGSIGVNWLYSDWNAGGVFLHDGIAWGNYVTDLSSIELGVPYWFKASYDGHYFSGKIWKDGDTEPDWQVQETMFEIDGSYVYSGIVGNSQDSPTIAHYSDFTIDGYSVNPPATTSAAFGFF